MAGKIRAPSGEELVHTNRWPCPPGPDVTKRLRHTLDAFSSEPDTWLVLMATSDVYGPGVKTGITLGDLRQLEARLALRRPE